MSAHRTGPAGAGGEARFDALLKAHVNRELTGVEEQRLRELATADPGRARQVREVARVHGAFARERELFDHCQEPAEPREEADEGYARLQAAAARAEADLRARLLHPVRRLRTRALRRRRPWILLSMAAAVVLGLLLFRGGGGPPELIPTPPGPETLGPGTGPGGAVRISLDAQIDAASRRVSWGAVAGARSYAVVVEDAAGNLVLERGDEHARSSSWDLTEAQFRLLRERASRGGLILRVVARDGAGIVVGTTGDLPLTVR